jgi:hypothetical protein
MWGKSVGFVAFAFGLQKLSKNRVALKALMYGAVVGGILFLIILVAGILGFVG